jgi:GNAT superfamily N-acetyltransferase
MTQSPLPLIRDITEADAAAWAGLYSAYRAFYQMPADDSVVTTAWNWLLARDHGMRGLVAISPDGTLLALANLRTFARPSAGTMGLYLDDLFTSPDARGTGVGGALLNRAAEIAGENGAQVVRWITATDNTTARRVYDAHATATAWVTYDMAPRTA